MAQLIASAVESAVEDVGGAAGEVLGPQPGRAACSFTEGVVECLLRVAAGVSILQHLPLISST